MIGEYDATGQLIQEIIWLGDLPVAVLKPTTPASATTDIYYIHADHLGTPRKVTRSNDNRIVWSWESEAFGNSLPDQNPSGLGNFVFNLRFPGQYYDQETGLFYNYFRDYDPGTGRYVESDPIGLRGGVNTYAYVTNNPLSWIDIFGLTAVCPQSPPKCDPNWVPYYGNPAIFHCGFEGYLENRSPTPDDPIGECFYDDFKNLVDANHSYASCGGTPDQYGKNQPFLHTLIDSGGIVRQGGPALGTSALYWIGRGGNSLINR